jgi:hypothetical protein
MIMVRQSVIVLDDFYGTPDKVRDIALSLDYKGKQNQAYPGGEAVAAGYDWTPVWQQLRSYIDEPCDAPCPKDPPFAQGKFRLATLEDGATRPDRVHLDVQRWSGIVYLSHNQDCEDGLALYRHRPTRKVEWDEEWFQEHYGWVYQLPPDEMRQAMFAYFRDPEMFEQIGVIPIAYNRAILLMAQVFHGTGAVFGTDKHTGRLSQHFEFYAEQ